MKFKHKEIVIYVPAEQINNAIGHRAANKKMLQENYRKVKFVPDTLLKGRNYHVDHS